MDSFRLLPAIDQVLIQRQELAMFTQATDRRRPGAHTLSAATLIGLTTILCGLLLAGPAAARNPDRSNWLVNLSEGPAATEPAEPDFANEIVTVGDTVHVIWITRNGDYSGYRLFYRRSTDRGRTWHPKQLVFSADANAGLSTSEEQHRLAVSGEHVHIAVNHYGGTGGGWYGVLSYIRSTDNGASFEAPRAIYNAGGAHHVYDLYVIPSANGVTIGFRHQRNWDNLNATVLAISDDQGESFSFRTAWFSETTILVIRDLQRDGDNIYLVGTHSNSSITYTQLYVLASQDGGQSFVTTKLSLPSGNGDDKAAFLQNYFYKPKIAAVGDRVSVIWAGRDAQDVMSVFLAHSTDAGVTWEPAQVLSAGLPAGKSIATGQETLAAAGNYVYALLLTTAGESWLRTSADGGRNFGTLRLLNGDSPATGSGWWPTLAIDPTVPAGAGVYVLWNRPTFVHSRDGGASFSGPTVVSPLDYGYWNRPKSAVGADGALHYTVYASTPQMDDDIFYRRIEPAPPAPLGETVLRVRSDRDEPRFDSMHATPRGALQVDRRLTAEAWVRFDADGATTGVSDVDRPFVYQHQSGDSYFAWSLGTSHDGPQRHARGSVRTPNGESWVNAPSNSEGVISQGAWAHLAMTYNADAGANNLLLYLNGQLIGSTTATGSMRTPGGLFFVGYYGNYDLDEVRVWNAARPSGDILATMRQPLTGREPGLAAYYNFNNTTADLSGNGNDGTLMYREEYVPGRLVYPAPPFCPLCMPTSGGWRRSLR